MPALDTSRSWDEVFFDFNGDLIPDELATTNDTGTITTGVSGGASILRLDNSNDGDNEMCEVDLGALYYQAQNGRISMEARFKLERVVCAVNVGFNDETTESSNTLPVELSGTTYTTNASTWVGVLADSDATTDTFRFAWVDDDNDGTGFLDSGITMAADTWYTVKIDLYDNGSGNAALADFFISDGTNSYSRQNVTTNIDRDVSLVPHIGIENRTTTGAYIDIDYLCAGQTRQA